MQSTVSAFEDIQRDVEIEYPRAIATMFRRCRTERSEDLGSQHKNLIDLAEVLIKFLGTVQLQECRHRLPDLKNRLPQKDKSLEFLERPSMGGWLGLLRVLSNLDINEEAAYWTHRVSSWYNAPKTAENRSRVEDLNSIEGVKANPKSGVPHAEILNGLVNYRNKQFAHAANFRREKLEDRLFQLEPVIAYLLDSASFLSELKLIRVDRAEISESEQWLIHGTALQGVSDEPVHILSDQKPNLKEVHICRHQEGEVLESPVSLAPFILYKTNQETSTDEVFVYNDAWRTRLEYISYESGSHYYHEELHREFEELVDLDVEPAAEEYSEESLSSEERAARADRCVKRAMVHKEEGRYEDAVELLEHSLQFDRRADTFLEIARLQRELGDPVESVLQTLQNALDISPEHQEALTLQKQLRDDTAPDSLQSTEDADDKGTTEQLTDESKRPTTPTIFHAVVPAELRSHALVGIVACLSGWYALSSAIEYVAGSDLRLLSKALQFTFCCLGVGVAKGRDLLVDLQTPLSLQLDNMRLERFQSWYDDQLEHIFGTFYFDNSGRLDASKSLQAEYVFYVCGFVWVLVLTTAAFFLAEVYRAESYILLAKRTIDWIIVYSVAWPLVRFIFMTTSLVIDFSNLSLKPSVTRIQDEGIHSFGSVLVFLTSLLTSMGIVYTGLAFLLVETNTYWDLFFLSVALAIFSLWSIALPFSLRYTMLKSKRKVANRYTSHIEKAFNDFLNTPGEKELEKYEWLMSHRDVIDRIVTWPLTPLQTTAIILCNILGFGTVGLYFASRLGYLPPLVDFIHF